MSLKNVKKSLRKISKSLESTYSSREYLIKNSREIIILSSQAIISIHKEDLKSAKIKIQKAKKLLEKYRKKTNGGLSRYLITPEQEVVEAWTLLSIIERKQIPSATTMQVSDEAYVLGLLDCVGELKRQVYDKIRIGKSHDALRIFEVMENLYLLLYPFATYDKIVKEVRRKLDVNRILVEDVRSALTEEIRRADLINAFSKEKKS